MRDNQSPTTHGNSGTSKLKSELREMDDDGKWKTDALKVAEEDAKKARRPGASAKEKTAGLTVPKKT